MLLELKIIKKLGPINSFIISLFLAATLIISATSCVQNETEPLLGDILVEVTRTNSDLEGVGYRVYSEAYLSATSNFPPLLTGTISNRRIEIKGINPGNYILELNAGTRWRIFLQATAGQERRFVIN
ncbi:hypothetical protein [Arthrospiribacter ruber]|uniref:Uncharacterized protein n=1 Tax=Arthrospiribacter ruber TaxID=2487934 RepID=A0A951IWD0_9BACT|nr:hypothetical protein [Arthrospiribacter ruber]MBW3466936.1 hypothetical protein [Arthrospiribacter ruber]